MLAESSHDRREWLERRLQELPGTYAASVRANALLDSRAHVLVRLDPEAVKGWSESEVIARRGGNLAGEKASASRDLSKVFERLCCSADTWRVRLEKLNKSRLFGRFFAASRQRLRDVAGELGVQNSRTSGMPGALD